MQMRFSDQSLAVELVGKSVDDRGNREAAVERYGLKPIGAIDWRAERGSAHLASIDPYA